MNERDLACVEVEQELTGNAEAVKKGGRI